MADSKDKKTAAMDVDRISALPDSVLCHILSFLPTAHSVATSSLSKRWTNLWRSVPSLRFSDADVQLLPDSVASLRFRSFVYSVLLSRDSNQSIESFRLKTSRNLFDFFNLNKWIQFVLQRRVKLLALIIDAPVPPPVLPHGILTSTTLEILVLDGFYVKNFPAVALPALKALHLFGIKFPNSRCLVEILAACPILEDFAAGSIQWDNHDFVTYQSLKNSSFGAKLVKAFVYQLNDVVFPLKVFSNVKYLCIDTTQVYGGVDLDIPNFHNLTHLDLKYFDYQHDWDLIMKLLKNSPKLQFLVLSQPENRFGVEEGVDREFVPDCLSLQLRTCTIEDFVGLPHEFQLANFIMKNAKVLQSMTIRCEEMIREGVVKMIKEVLSACPRASATCQLSVC